MTLFALRHSLAPWAICTALLSLSSLSHALTVVSASPQGETAQVSQVVVKFDQAAVNFGDPKAPQPLNLTCTGDAATQGYGNWTSEREWVWRFGRFLPPGVRCTAQMLPTFKSPKGDGIQGLSSFKFNTGGPFVEFIHPTTDQTIDEEQYFLLRLNGPASTASVQANAWCVLEGLGERVPVRVLDDATRDALVRSQSYDIAGKRGTLAFVALACQRRFTPGSKVQLVWGKGISAPEQAGTAAVANSVEKRFKFTVREPFLASFSCERENAQAACLPIRPMRVSFNADVPRKLALGMVLKSAQGSFKAQKDTDDVAAGDDAVVSSIRFQTLLPENTAFTLEVPKGFVDASGRALSNASNFPMKVATAGMPPLVKFPVSPFGVIERFAEGEQSPALLPVTLRRVESSLLAKGIQAGSKVTDVALSQDADIIRWFLKVQAANQGQNESRDKPLLNAATATTLQLPPSPEGQVRPFEVVGIPLKPGFHVVEIASAALGRSLLDPKLGPQRLMHVRTSALVTNLGVHFKLGRDGALAWVTTLDKGKPVANATVQVSDCRGKAWATGTTNAQGVAQLGNVPAEAPSCEPDTKGTRPYKQAYFVSARHTASDGVPDMAFTWSDWTRGIENWRFQVPTSRDMAPDQRAHTVLDRSLLRAGETVSMKHFLRTETSKGLGLPDTTPDLLTITHLGSGQSYTQALKWRKTGTGGLSAQSQFQIPPAAKLGAYEMTVGNRSTGQFRVEEFRLPVLEGSINPTDKKPLVNVTQVPTQLQVNYVSGGPAGKLPVRVSAFVRGKTLNMPGFDDFSFSAPRGAGDNANTTTHGEEEAAENNGHDQRTVADKLPLVLDKNGTGKVTIDKLQTAANASRQPRDLVLEATYADPNGEMQTLRHTSTLWPATVVTGIKTEGWVSVGQTLRFQALALTLAGQAQADVAMSVRAQARTTSTSRKRMVGGFYSYDNATDVRDLGEVCSGKSDARGLLLCDSTLPGLSTNGGEVELVVTAKDGQGNTAQAASNVWITRQGELWFGADNHDRMDVLPEKKAYSIGETAKFQVRMPFRFATALVAVEREGILSTQVVQLNGKDPTISLKVEEGWGPNVYVSVLALRGRLREVPWYSLFTWGYKAPREWWASYWYEGREYTAPTALIDLSKPAYKLGVAEIQVGVQSHRLDVKVSTDKDSYPVRGKAQVTITANLPNGQAAAGAEVALAAVDQALLELMPNTSWNVLEAMWQRRPWGVETSTAQMEIVGRRHYGRKAVPAGGGGGRSSTRELLDTLLLWQPNIVLDAKGQATVTVPLNDALTSFKIVAVADAQAGLFGTGSASIRSMQDLQLISGLPPLVREDDQYRAQFTLRNTTKAAMKVQVTARATLLNLEQRTLEIPAGEAKEVTWDVTAPAQLAQTRSEAILWEVEAKDLSSGAKDALKARQRIVPAVPLTVQQSTLVQWDGAFSLDVAPPPDALPGRGGVRVSLQPTLAGGLPGVRDWFLQYPFSCLEQQVSKTVGLRDAKQWQTLVAQIPTYLDGDGLANYFPPREGMGNQGSDTLTAYLLAATHEAMSLDPAFALPDAVRLPMERGLIHFVEGRLQRDFWSPRKDLDMRKIGALEALSRHGKAQARMLGSITIAPNQWPTHTVIDWLNILQRIPDLPDRGRRMAEAHQILKSRLSYQGSRLTFSTERDDQWWWLMANGDVNTARLLLTVMDDPAWKDDLARLANGFMGRQQRGAWSTTTANLWGGLALEKFSAAFESQPVNGLTKASLGDQTAQVNWRQANRHMLLPWPQGTASQSTTPNPNPSAALRVTHQGSGKPWLTLQSLAAVPLKAPYAAGYQIKKTMTPLAQATPGKYTRGDVLRITLEVTGTSDMTWVVITDPIPGGATLLGSGLGRDSEIATRGETRSGAAAWPAFEERSFEAFRSYYAYLPKGSLKLDYTVRLNNAGSFALPPSRVEAMYAPEMFAEVPNARMTVGSGQPSERQ